MESKMIKRFKTNDEYFRYINTHKVKILDVIIKKKLIILNYIRK